MAAEQVVHTTSTVQTADGTPETSWFVMVAGQQYPARDLAMLQGWAKEGRFDGTAQVFHPASKTWSQASLVPELGGSFRNTMVAPLQRPRRRWLWVVGGLLLLVILAAGMPSSDDSSSVSSGPATKGSMLSNSADDSVVVGAPIELIGGMHSMDADPFDRFGETGATLMSSGEAILMVRNVSDEAIESLTAEIRFVSADGHEMCRIREAIGSPIAPGSVWQFENSCSFDPADFVSLSGEMARDLPAIQELTHPANYHAELRFRRDGLFGGTVKYSLGSGAPQNHVAFHRWR